MVRHILAEVRPPDDQALENQKRAAEASTEDCRKRRMSSQCTHPQRNAIETPPMEVEEEHMGEEDVDTTLPESAADQSRRTFHRSTGQSTNPSTA